MPKTSEYIDEVPWEIPAGKILVHNHVAVPKREEYGPDVEPYQLGLNGFRAWITDFDPAIHAVCPCDWAGELGDHYHVIAARWPREDN